MAVTKDDLIEAHEAAATELGPEGLTRLEEWRAASPLVASSQVAFARFRMDRAIHLRKLLIVLRFWTGFRDGNTPDDFIARSGEIAWLQFAYGKAAARAIAWGQYLMDGPTFPRDRSTEGRELSMDLDLRHEVRDLFANRTIDAVLGDVVEECTFYEVALRWIASESLRRDDWMNWRKVRNRLLSERDNTWLHSIEKGRLIAQEEMSKQEAKRLDAKLEKARNEGLARDEDDLLWSEVAPLTDWDD